MKSTIAKVLAALTLVSLGLLLWTTERRPRGTKDAPGATTEPAGVERARPPQAPTGSGAPREPALAPDAPLEGAGPSAGGTAHVFRARILDRAGRPLAGAWLHLPARSDVEPVHSSARGEAELVVAGAIPRQPGNGPARLDGLEPAAGTDSVGPQGPAEEPLCVRLVAGAEGHGAVERFLELGDEHVHELSEIRLTPIGTVAGRLLGPDLAPLPGHTVRLAQPAAGVDRMPERRLSGPLSFHAETKSDAEGRFSFEGTPEGLWHVWGGGDGFLWSCGPLLRVARELTPPESELVLEHLPARSELRGRVLRPDGSPSVGTRVKAVPSDEDARQTYWRQDLTDDEGRFALPAVPGLAYDVTAHGRGWSHLPAKAPRSRTLQRVVPGPAELELRLQEALTLEVLVSDRAGRPVTEFELFAPGEGVFAAWHREVEDEHGHGLVEVPDHAFRLVVRAEGFAQADLGVFAPGSAPSSLAVTLERLARVRGHVRAHGRALAGAVVEIVKLADGHSILVMEGFPSRWDQRVYRQVRTDERGAFELPVLEPGRFALRAEHAGQAPLELGPFELDPRRDERVDFELGQGGALEGRVLVPPGQSPAGVQVSISRGDGKTRRAATDARGRYHLERLMPGRYMAEASYTRVEERGGGFEPIETIVSEEEFEFPWVLEIFDGETTVHDLDLAAQDVARLEGTLRIDGRTHGLATARVLPGSLPWNDLDSPRMQELALEPGGRFVFEDLRTGPLWLVLGLGGAPLDGLVVVRRLELQRGENRTDLELESAGLGGPRPAGEAPLALLAELDEETFALLTLDLDAPFLHLPGLPAAETAWLVEPGTEPDPFRWRRHAEFALRPGEWTGLE